MTTPTDPKRASWVDHLLATVDKTLDGVVRIVQRSYEAVHERRVIRDARRGLLGERRDADSIREHARRLGT